MIMTNRRSVAVASAVLLAWVGVPRAHAQEVRPSPVVVVHGEQSGQGMTRMDQGDCFVIAPDHVVRGYPPVPAPDSVYTVGAGAKLIFLELVEPRQSFFILRVPDASRDLCVSPPSASRVRRTAARIHPGGTRGTLSQGLSSGNPTGDSITVYPLDAARIRMDRESSDRIRRRGISGSLLYVGRDPVGMVMQTLPDQAPEVYRLDHVEEVVGSFFRYRRRPTTGDVLLSVVVPGQGQRATTRVRTGWGLTLGTALAVGVGARYLRDTKTEMRTFQGDSLIPSRQYPYEVRTYPLRKPEYIAAAWFGVGLATALETVLHVHTRYPAPNSSPRAGAPNAAVRIRPEGVDGGTGVALSVEVTF